MAVLARASAEQLSALWAKAGLDAEHEMVRGPETGLVTVRGRIGGGGSPFNVGEATVTRATVRLATGAVGHAYALGRDKEKSRISAVIDALWQDETLRPKLTERILTPLARDLENADAAKCSETAATRVDFFTMVRGEDE
ncbi:MAG: phosphonate C-P lyase system protein PhnG [Rhizobiaceae bacterium]|nr:phosphonate C-P lyase system protein PhnG [Rhizobiaceae bacterium]